MPALFLPGLFEYYAVQVIQLHTLKKILAEDPLRTVSWMQGVYYLAFGLWSILDISSFQAVTGPKVDLWLVRTVGLLLIVCSAALVSAAFHGAPGLEAAIIGIGTALALAAIDIIYVSRGIISAIYLLDAVAEVAFAAGWIAGGYWKLKARS